jgi:hypothetical protein
MHVNFFYLFLFKHHAQVTKYQGGALTGTNKKDTLEQYSSITIQTSCKLRGKLKMYSNVCGQICNVE